MADTPIAPAKRGRPRKVVDGTTTVKPKASKATSGLDMRRISTPALGKVTETTRDALDKGWTAKVAPIKAKAEKAAKVATGMLNDVDWKAHVEPLKDQAAKTALSAAGVAKDKTGTAMQSLAKLISDTAGTVDAKLGPQYGDYARQAAQSVAGAADSLDSQDVDQLMAQARDFVRKSPAVAIGAAAVVGFVLMRLAKGSGDA